MGTALDCMEDWRVAMNTEDLTRSIDELPVFDTHSHLNAPDRPLGARGFGDVGHYFWLSQQMQGVGWRESERLDQNAAEAYFDANCLIPAPGAMTKRISPW